MGKYGTDRQTARDHILLRMRSACWISKARIWTQSERSVHIDIALQQRLRERASVLRYNQKACLEFDSTCQYN